MSTCPPTNRGVTRFFIEVDRLEHAVYISVVTVGEPRRGVEVIRHRKDVQQAKRLESWLESLLDEYEDHILAFGREESEVWERLRVSHPENALDKQIAATALTHELTIVTRNASHFEKLGLPVVDPFE